MQAPSERLLQFSVNLPEANAFDSANSDTEHHPEFVFNNLRLPLIVTQHVVLYLGTNYCHP